MHLRSSLFLPAQAWLFLALPLLGCSENHPPPPAASAAASVVVAPAAPPASAAEPAPVASAAAPPREIAGAAQILVSYTGAEIAAKTVTRTKDAAKKRAAEVAEVTEREQAEGEEALKDLTSVH